MKQLLLIIFLLSSTGTSAALNKWVDADGRVHYSDTPPSADVKVKKLRTFSVSEDTKNQSTTGESTPAAAKTIAEREAELKKVQLEKRAADDKAAKEQAYAEALKASCNTARQNLRTLQEGERMMEIDANGERSYMSDERRKEKVSKAQQEVSSYCK